MVVSRRGDPSSIRTPSGIGHPAPMPGEHADHAARLRIPDPDARVSRRRQNQPGAGLPLEGIDGSGAILEKLDDLPVGWVADASPLKMSCRTRFSGCQNLRCSDVFDLGSALLRGLRFLRAAGV